MASTKSYTWSYRIDVAPYDRIMSVLEAFFASYPKGDYQLEHKESYKLIFRRGMWKKSMFGLGDLVPDRLIPGEFNQWPLIVRILARPSPEVYTITIDYQLYLPKDVPALKPEIQTSVDQHIHVELKELAEYLAQCIGMDQTPQIQSP
jgi:hypothetical protein